jgi:hypothetical protein
VPLGQPSSSEAFVAVVEAADFGQLGDLAHLGCLYGSRHRRVLAQGQMRSRPMVIGEMEFQDPVQMLLAQVNDVSRIWP